MTTSTRAVVAVTVVVTAAVVGGIMTLMDIRPFKKMQDAAKAE